MKKLLVLTYYWPPAGGSGVQRWLKFTRYLRDYGWEPVIYTPKNPDYPLLDPSLQEELPDGLRVIKTKIREPFALYRTLSGSRKAVNVGFAGTKKKGLLNKVFIWIRGNFFIPDSRKLWIKPSVRFLLKLAEEEHFDAMVSTGPPHSMHMIAYGLKQKRQIPWLADFRDPWTSIDYAGDLKLTKSSKLKHAKLERQVLQTADVVVGVSEGMTRELDSLGAKEAVTITNGFDPADFIDVDSRQDDRFIISHVGVMPESRNPSKLWFALGELVNEVPDFAKSLCIQLVGEVDQSVLSSISEAGLANNLESVGHVDHASAISFMQNASVLLLVINRSINAKSILTGKVFEYMGAKRPILAIGPKDGDIASVLEKAEAGTIVDYDDEAEIKEFISSSFSSYLTGDRMLSRVKSDLYSRPYLTKVLSETLDRITK